MKLVKRINLISCCLFVSLQVTAGGEKWLFGARSLGMGHASVTFTDMSSAYNNQAGLGFVSDPGVTSYTEQRFLLSEMTYGGLCAVLPTQSGTFSLSTTYFGYSNFNDTQIGLGYGLKLSENFSAGVQVDYLRTSVIEYGSKSNFTFEAGLLAKMTDKLTFAAHVYNPIRAQLGESLGITEKIPGILKAGFSYLEEDKFLLTTEVEKDIDYDPFIKVGLEVYLSDKLFVRGGVGTQPSYFTLGMGYKVNNLSIDIAGSQNEYISFTPAVSLSWKFIKQSE